jgi:Tfp pilus assembly protein PilF
MKDLSALERDTNYKEAMEWHQKGDVKNVLLGLEKTVKENPDHVLAWNNLGFILYHTKYVKEAENAFRKALSIEPDYVDAHVNLCYLLIENKRTDEAKAYYEKIKALEPDNSELKEMESKLSG